MNSITGVCIAALRSLRAGVQCLLARAVRVRPHFSAVADIETGAFYRPVELCARIVALSSHLLDAGSQLRASERPSRARSCAQTCAWHAQS
eukprot:7081916-Pyramimonas_sp.AAC.1